RSRATCENSRRPMPVPPWPSPRFFAFVSFSASYSTRPTVEFAPGNWLLPAAAGTPSTRPTCTRKLKGDWVIGWIQPIATVPCLFFQAVVNDLGILAGQRVCHHWADDNALGRQRRGQLC